MNWKYRVKIKHLMTDKEDDESIQKSMNDIADVLEKQSCFVRFNLIDKFRCIPKGDEVVDSVSYANTLINRMYDYADENKIWIE